MPILIEFLVILLIPTIHFSKTGVPYSREGHYFAKSRGIDIAGILINDVIKYDELIDVMTETTVVGIYDENVITLLKGEEYIKIKAKIMKINTKFLHDSVNISVLFLFDNAKTSDKEVFAYWTTANC